jgi:hypothetical protein
VSKEKQNEILASYHDHKRSKDGQLGLPRSSYRKSPVSSGQRSQKRTSKRGTGKNSTVALLQKFPLVQVDVDAAGAIKTAYPANDRPGLTSKDLTSSTQRKGRKLELMRMSQSQSFKDGGHKTFFFEKHQAESNDKDFGQDTQHLKLPF